MMAICGDVAGNLATLELHNGVNVPTVGLGTYRSRGLSVTAAVSWALELGVRHIDTASIYKNARDIHQAIITSAVPASNIFVTSKLSPFEQGTEKATKACNAILERHAAQCIDLVLIHWPATADHSPDSAIHANERLETWRVLEQYYRAGKFRAIGVSNYEQRHLEELLAVATIRPMVNQVEVHPRYPQSGLRKLCSDHGVVVMAYSSLGVGDLVHNASVQQVAQESQHTPAQVLLKWGLQKGCAVIPKSLSREHIAEASPDTLLSWKLTTAQMQQLDLLEDGHKYCWDPKCVL